MKIIEIGGIDGSGKTTQVQSLLNEFSRIYGLRVIIAPKRIPLEPLFPQHPDERKEWYLKAPVGDIVTAHISSTINRIKICNNNLNNYDIILEDRGYYTILSSLIARVMQRKHVNFREAKSFVYRISDEKKLSRIEDKNYILNFVNWKIAKNEIIKRGELVQEGNFGEYLKKFYYVINHLTVNKNNVFLSSAKGDSKYITKSLLEKIIK